MRKRKFGRHAVTRASSWFEQPLTLQIGQRRIERHWFPVVLNIAGLNNNYMSTEKRGKFDCYAFPMNLKRIVMIVFSVGFSYFTFHWLAA